MFSGLGRFLGSIIPVGGLAACSASDAQSPSAVGAPQAGGLVIAFEDVAAPEAFATEVSAATADGGEAGLWVAVPGLRRPERGLVQSSATGRSIVAALFRAPAGGGATLSRDATRALGLAGGGPTPVRIVAIRSEIRLSEPATGF